MERRSPLRVATVSVQLPVVTMLFRGFVAGQRLCWSSSGAPADLFQDGPGTVIHR
jgi:hypothetical protein